MKTYATSGNLFAVRLADNWSLFFISVNFYNCRVLLLPPQNGIQLLSSFHFFFPKLNCLMFGFSSKKVLKRDSSMAAFVTVHAGSFCGLQEMSFNISHFYLFVFLHCRHKMKYSCYQDSSVIRSWFVYLVWIEEDFAAGFKSNLQASEYRKRLGPHLLGLRSYIHGEWQLQFCPLWVLS